jgi:hypothetical protein
MQQLDDEKPAGILLNKFDGKAILLSSMASQPNDTI